MHVRHILTAAALAIAAAIGGCAPTAPSPRAAGGDPPVAAASAPVADAGAVTAPAATRAAGVRPRNLLIVTLDTTRADVLGCYGGDALVSPNIDALAARGVQFMRAYSALNVTNPSHLAIMTGRRAMDYGVFGNMTRLNPRTHTLQTVMRGAGFRTAAYFAVRHLYDAEWPGLENTDACVPCGTDEDSATADVVAEHAIRWLTGVGGEPFSLWVHFYDPHRKYAPPPDVAERFLKPDPREADGGPRRFLPEPPGLANAGAGTAAHWRRYQALYAGDTHVADRGLGRLLEELKRTGRADDTLVVVVADHGESFGEHDIYFGHQGLFEQQLHVPLIIAGPGVRAGSRVETLVTHQDLAPTIAELFGLKFPHEFRGVSLASTMHGRPNPALEAPRDVIHEAAHNKQTAVRRDRWKLIIPNVPVVEHSGKPLRDPHALFDLKDDPAELNNLLLTRPDEVRILSALMADWSRLGLVKERTPRDPAAAGRLKALGYLDD